MRTKSVTTRSDKHRPGRHYHPCNNKRAPYPYTLTTFTKLLCRRQPPSPSHSVTTLRYVGLCLCLPGFLITAGMIECFVQLYAPADNKILKFDLFPFSVSFFLTVSLSSPSAHNPFTPTVKIEHRKSHYKTDYGRIICFNELFVTSSYTYVHITHTHTLTYTQMQAFLCTV